MKTLCQKSSFWETLLHILTLDVDYDGYTLTPNLQGDVNEVYSQIISSKFDVFQFRDKFSVFTDR